ncbi:4Fe-4S binding protein [Caldivirga maquilingensis]|uniref:4Fe-4S ferredoxin iron-sulfur binding domain protein n=1 Tax=Caldivirga maquilingensis (strain ATCC 700844 / DSM 13496 / JCM 10307 / IC-167) TaxID=397948 RepID=A8MBM4_CALMQ|nr:4Fe-4S dicluster domain-containing protein [Caldivirga maquilingensis]ABW02757.1 4Fe-4S ferredoxin iron-sulfur binding domain protein [Caldivirga maquilingensis IC-167]
MNLWLAYFTYGGAAGMVLTIAVTLRFYKNFILKNELNLHRLLWILYILVSMSLMYGLALYYLLNKSMYSLFTAILVSNVTMVSWLILITTGSGGKRNVYSPFVNALVTGLILIAEYLMSLTYAYLTGVTRMLPVNALNSPWFTIPMTMEALLSYTLIKPRNIIGRLAPVLILNMVFNPLSFNFSYWPALSIYASAVLMTIAVVVILDYMYRKSILTHWDLVFSLGSVTMMGIMMLIQFLGLLNNTYWRYYGLSLLVDMAFYLYMYVHSEVNPRPLAWITKPYSLTALLLLVFISEALMGGVVSIQAGWLNPIGVARLLSINNSLGALIINLITLTSALTLSPGFLIMMGAEMGWLVLSRFRELKHLENKVRFMLMFLAYWLYTVYVPSFLPSWLIKYPYLYWSMGLGTAGPLSPMLLTAIIGTYVINAVLSLLFGSRQLCSVTCSASYMWQGTFYNKLKTSPMNPLRGSRRGLIHSVRIINAVLIYGALGVLAYLSLMDQLGHLRFYINGEDPLIFLYLLLFGFLWYISFALAPILGTYNCVTYGWCHWGLFNQAVGRLGLFKLVVKDPGLCIECKTKDCAKACPVGNSNMPGSFIKKGYYKSSTCIGVGDCVEACPYNNIIFYDARAYFKNKLTLRPLRVLLKKPSTDYQ